MIITTELKKTHVSGKSGWYKTTLQKLLFKSGISIDGRRPWDIRIHNDAVYTALVKKGSLGLGESYMNGWWDCDKPDEFIFHILHADLEKEVPGGFKAWSYLLKSRLFNLQTPKKSLEVGRKHYDIGNDLYQAMLDKRMMYSCAYWKDATTLDEAQERKLDLICRKLKLEAGQRVLDIGCGWGGFAA